MKGTKLKDGSLSESIKMSAYRNRIDKMRVLKDARIVVRNAPKRFD
jgi:hypothetical protein